LGLNAPTLGVQREMWVKINPSGEGKMQGGRDARATFPIRLAGTVR